MVTKERDDLQSQLKVQRTKFAELEGSYEMKLKEGTVNLCSTGTYNYTDM